LEGNWPDDPLGLDPELPEPVLADPELAVATRSGHSPWPIPTPTKAANPMAPAAAAAFTVRPRRLGGVGTSPPEGMAPHHPGGGGGGGGPNDPAPPEPGPGRGGSPAAPPAPAGTGHAGPPGLADGPAAGTHTPLPSSGTHPDCDSLDSDILPFRSCPRHPSSDLVDGNYIRNG
jgi:hypothetical protein